MSVLRYFKRFQSNTTIVTLDLHDNNMGDDGMRYIAEMIKENCYIVSLVSHFLWEGLPMAYHMFTL